MILLDTNILARMADADDPQCAIAQHAVGLLIARRERVVIALQNLFEFWSVATWKLGPPPTGQNGLGLTPEFASKWHQFFLGRFTLLYDKDDLLTLWHDLVKRLGITGLRSHDIRLVAAMQSHGVATLLTFNIKHFRDCPITVLDPGSL